MSEKLLERLQFHNPWWQTGVISPALALPYKRQAFYEILHWLSKLERIIILKGPRRTGKTTILHQIIERLLLEGHPPGSILYLTFDDPSLQLPLREIFDLFESKRGQDLTSSPRTFIFLDEVPFLPSWETEVKLLFDKKMPVQFFVSGSASTLIRKGSESLAGRTIEKVLLPFSFAEFIKKEYGPNLVEFQGLAKNQKQVRLAWGRFLSEGGFPEIIGLESEEKASLLKTDIVDKVIYKDLTQLYQIRDALSLEKLFRFIIENTSGILNVSELAGFLGLSRETIKNYLLYLQQAYLVFTLPKFSRSTKETVRSLEKVHIIDQSLSFIYPGATAESIVESVVARHFWEKHPSDSYYWRYKYEVDLVLEKDNTLQPVEVKTSQTVSKSSLRGLINFCKEFGLKEGLVLYYGEKKEMVSEEIKINFVPVYNYLLN